MNIVGINKEIFNGDLLDFGNLVSISFTIS